MEGEVGCCSSPSTVSSSSQEPTLDKSGWSKQSLIEDNIEKKHVFFKQFDIVQYSHGPEGGKDHYYDNIDKPTFLKLFVNKIMNKPRDHQIFKPSKNWTKRIQKEWKMLEKDLPDAIFVRVYEDRMDLLRAVIIGPSRTPYQDGLFFFDVHFPSNYPDVPPNVCYHSHGYRLNPNLYACGKVCLSLLGTWTGKRSCEKWNPGKSTMLQVLVSLQGLVLNEKPYYNEPGFGSHPEINSLSYNNKVFLLSCNTMICTMRNPPKHFEDFVIGHFRRHGEAIMVGCTTWLAKTHANTDIGIHNVEGDAENALSSDSESFTNPTIENLSAWIKQIQVCDEIDQEATGLNKTDKTNTEPGIAS